MTTNAEAAIKGNGKIATTGNIDVKATGLANAHSGVVTPNSLSGIKIAANILTSKLAAVQKAYIANVEITKAGNLTVESNLNESNDYGAKSILDSTAKSLDSVDITYIRGTANTATAMAEALSAENCDQQLVGLSSGTWQSPSGKRRYGSSQPQYRQ